MIQANYLRYLANILAIILLVTTLLLVISRGLLKLSSDLQINQDASVPNISGDDINGLDVNTSFPEIKDIEQASNLNETLIPETVDIMPAPLDDESVWHGTRIPKILHQFWDDEVIPTEMVENVKKLTRDNGPGKSWQYFFWTMKSARQLIVDKYPDFLQYFDNYPDDLSRSDAIRYIFLYEYGGVYLDLDTVSIKPLDSFLDQHICAFTMEAEEHLAIYEDEFLLTNSAMFCRPRHPFFRHIINSLPSYLHNNCKNAYTCTGPAVLTDQFKEYSPKPYDYIEIVPTDLFQDLYFVKFRAKQLRIRCGMTKQTEFQKSVCKMWKARGGDARPLSHRAFTVHMYHFTHRSGKQRNVSFKPKNNITRTLLPETRR